MALDWPESLEPTDVLWGVVNNNRAFTSTLSNAQQVFGFPGAYWQCTLNFGVLYPEDERELTALLGRLQGMFGTVKIPAIHRQRDDDIGNPVVAAAGALALTMQLSGVTPSAKVFRLGDYISVGGEMFEVVQDATSTSGGAVTVQLNKRIRKAIPVGTAVEYRRPFAIMRRVDDTNQVNVQPVVSNASFPFREDLS